MPKTVTTYASCFGPYLRYAISTSFKDFEPFDDKELLLLVEFNEAHVAADRFLDDMSKVNATSFYQNRFGR